VSEEQTYTAFADQNMIASGPVDQVLSTLKQRFDKGESSTILVFEDWSGQQVDFNLHGSLYEVLMRELPLTPHTSPGRPRLGVVSREISLLPRHWQWLEKQPNGASAALRRLVDQARSQDQESNRVWLAIEASGRFMSAMAGNLPGYEEATRALYAHDRPRLESLIAAWPQDVRQYALRFLGDCI
jgi:hypothetical protein